MDSVFHGRFRAKCFGGVMCLLLVCHVVHGRDKMPPAQRAEALKMIEKENRDLPLVREESVASRGVRHLHILPATGEVIALGERGMIVVTMRHLKSLQNETWPQLVSDTILAAAFHEDAEGGKRQVFLATTDGLVHNFRVGKTEPIRTFPGDEMWADPNIRAIAPSPDAALLAVTGDSNKVRLYETETGKELVPFAGSDTVDAGTSLGCLAFTSDAKAIVCGDDAGRIYRFDPRDVATWSELPAHQEAIAGIAVTDDGVVISASVDGMVRTTSLDTGSVLKTATVPAGRIDHFCFAYDGLGDLRVVVASETGQIALLDGQTLEVLAEVPAGAGRLTALGVDRFARFFAAAFDTGKVGRWLTRRMAQGEKAQETPRDFPPFSQEDYDAPTGRIGMKLEKVTGGFQLVGYLPGARCFPSGPKPGDVITHVEWPDEWRPLSELTRDLPSTDEKMAPLEIRFLSREDSDEREETEIAIYASPRELFEEARDILVSKPTYHLGIQFTWQGYIHRVDPEGAAAAAGIVAGDTIAELNGTTLTKGYNFARQQIAEGTAVSLKLRRGFEGPPRQVQIQPAMRSKAHQKANQAMLYRRASYMEKAETLQQQAIALDRGDCQVYLVLFDPVAGHEQAVKLLEKGIQNARHRLPLVEKLVRYYLKTWYHDEAHVLITEWQNVDEPDHKLALLQAKLLVQQKEDPRLLETLARQLKVMADERRDPEALPVLSAALNKLKRWEEADACRKRRRQLEQSIPSSSWPKHPSL